MILNLGREKIKKRSPLTTKPLRLPGQSLQEEINRRVDKGIEYIVIIGISLSLVLFEWLNWYFKSPPNPVYFTAIIALVWFYCFWKIVQTRKDVRILKQAREGEKVVGQSLEGLRERGYRVLHDIVGDGFNIDHVLIGPTGVYTIETKTISKPAKGACEISYDGETICVNGLIPDRDPIVQAKAQANWLQNFLKDSTGKFFEVRPVVLYPGWFIKAQPKGVKVWVLNHRALPSFIKNEKVRLDASNIQSIEFSLATYSTTSATKSE